jgi:hypothetical protein
VSSAGATRINKLTPHIQLKHIHVRNKDTSAAAKSSQKNHHRCSWQTHNKQHQQQFFRDDSMQFSVMAGWVYPVVRMVRGEAESQTNRVVARDLDCAILQTAFLDCRFMRNALENRLNIRVWQLTTSINSLIKCSEFRVIP